MAKQTYTILRQEADRAPGSPDVYYVVKSGVATRSQALLEAKTRSRAEAKNHGSWADTFAVALIEEVS